MPILGTLLDLALAAALLAICVGLGGHVLRRLRVRFQRPLEELAFAAALGLGIEATAILVLGALGAIRPIPLALLVLATAALARRELVALPALLARGAASLCADAGGVGAALLAVLGLFLISQAALPPVDWDSLMYHLRVPLQFLERGRIYLPEDNLHAAQAQLAHMLYLPLLAFGSPSAPAILSAFLALLLAGAAVSFCSRFLSDGTARWSLPFVLGNAVLLMVAVTARVDVTLAAYLFLAQYVVCLARGEPTDRRPLYLALAGALLGFAFGVKYHGLAYGAALGPLALWAAGSHDRRLSSVARPMAVFGLAAAAAALPWLLKNAVLFGAPLYPFLAPRRMEPWLVALYGVAAPPSSVPPQAYDVLHQVRSPLNVLDLFWAPGRLSVEAEAALYFVSPILLALPLWVFFRTDRTLNALLFPALGYLAIVVLFSRTTNLRYLIPALVPLTLVAAHVVVRLVSHSFAGRPARAALLLMASLSLTPTVLAAAARVTQARALGYLAGIVSRDGYLQTHRLREVSMLAGIASVVREAVPEGGRVLMLVEARGLYFEREVIQDNLLTNWPYLAPRVAEGECLSGTDITHVLVGDAGLAYYARRGLDLGALSWDAFAPFAERCLEPVGRGYGFTLYRVRVGQPPR